MASKREQVLSALFGRLQAIPLASVKRNEALPQIVPAGGLVIMRDGDPGELLTGADFRAAGLANGGRA